MGQIHGVIIPVIWSDWFWDLVWLVDSTKKRNEISPLDLSFFLFIHNSCLLSTLGFYEARQIKFKSPTFAKKNIAMALAKNTYVKFFLLSAVLAGLVVLLQQVLPQIIHSQIWEIYFFLLIMFFLIHVLTGFLLKASSENFFQISLLAMILRLISSFVFVGIEVWAGMENIILFISDFFVLFLFYLIFDIYTFIANLRPISK